MSSRTLLTVVLAGTAALASSPAGAQVHPLPPQQPIPACFFSSHTPPVGPNQAPPDLFADPALFHNPTPAHSNDYHWIHSSVHLQGAGALQKWGACLFFNPDKEQTTPIDMSDWRSALIVNNPSRGHTVTATITYRDPQGNVLGPVNTVTIPPEQTYVRGAIELRLFGRGIGSVEVNANHPIVGATLHHFNKLTLSNGRSVSNTSSGANSMQQLQMSQDVSILYSGPFPFSNSSAEDFLNGVLPVNCVLNPNPTPTTLKVVSTNLPIQTVTLPPFGMHLDTSLWKLTETAYLNPLGLFNKDIITLVESDGNPILGDFLMVDVFGNGPPANLVPAGSFRMGSGMMQNDPASRLINPEHTETGPFAQPPPPPQPSLPKTPPVETMMSIANVSGSDVGPVTVEFFARANGGLPLATLSFPSLPSFAVQRITPATSLIPENFAGWARITACGPGLIGWTMREVMQQTVPFTTPQFREVYGEELEGANGGEPGQGIPVQLGGQPWISKVAPLLRAGNDNDPFNWWPGYVNGVNSGTANLGSYWHRFFTLDTGMLVGQQNFAGLSFANSSFTYVDPIVTVTANTNVSGRFDATVIGASGMEAIGDPLVEWGIKLFLGPDVEPFLLQSHEP